MEEIKERAPRRADGGVGCETYCRQSDRREGEGLGGGGGNPIREREEERKQGKATAHGSRRNEIKESEKQHWRREGWGGVRAGRGRLF